MKTINTFLLLVTIFGNVSALAAVRERTVFPAKLPDELRGIIVEEDLLPHKTTTNYFPDNSKPCIDYGECHPSTVKTTAYYIDDRVESEITRLLGLDADQRQTLIDLGFYSQDGLMALLTIGEIMGFGGL
ncbi:MAG: hypothetical protein AB7T49_21410 [Oligoflexales bacterium]